MPLAIPFAVGCFFLGSGSAQQPPPASGARTLLLPRRVVSGERATLAVLDVNGRLTPGVTVNFSNGDKLVTDATGRALFVAPLSLGVVYASIDHRRERAPTAVVSTEEGTSSLVKVNSAPLVASISDQFEIAGSGFCGDADVNQVSIGGKAAFVLASSPSWLVVLPSTDLEPGPAAVQISCANRSAPAFHVTLVALQLEADSSPLAPGEHRILSVHVSGTTAKVALEAHNRAPEIAELAGGNLVRVSSPGGARNAAKFELVGRKRGSFVISIKLVQQVGPPRS